MIEVSHIVFEYPGKRALKDVSFSIAAGSVTALVGPNGAGKTTLMRCIAALDEPFSGDVMVDGINVREQPREVHRRIGYLSDFFGLYDDLTVSQCLTFIARIHQLPETGLPEKVLQTAGLLGLQDYFHVKAGTLSRGLRQRLGIAQAIIHAPKVLLLDEPASGLDPEARISLSRLFLSLRDQGMTLVISSHILSELEDYCTDMLLLRDGKVQEYRSAHPASGAEEAGTLVITFCEPAGRFGKELAKIDGLGNARIEGNTLECAIAGGDAERHELLKVLLKHKLPVCGFTVKKKRLQDIYMDFAQEKGK